MFSVIFPGQGSQLVGMGKGFYDKYTLVQDLFKEADESLGFSLSSLILNGPKESLDLTENTQPAIFLISYSIFKIIKEEFNINLNKANFFAGHSLGEYSALASAGALSFSDTLKILKIRGKVMQNSVPKGLGGMVAVLGSEIKVIENIIEENKTKYKCYIANDNSDGQIVLSGNINDLEKMMQDLKANNIKNIKLPVSAPFHCSLMNKATLVMKEEISKLNFEEPKNTLISNVTGKEISDSNELKKLLIEQIESRVRWRESVILMINKGVTQFIEIGPGKVLTGLIKRIDKNVKVSAINTEEDIKLIKEEFKIDLNKASFFAGHSLGEYSALASAGSLRFSDTLKILKIRGKAMQSSVPKGVGGMVAVLGSEIKIIENFISENKSKYECYIANDNSVGQIVLSGNIKDLEKIMIDLKSANIKNIKLPVSAPFHCKLMHNATLIMREELAKLNFNEPKNILISNVTAKEISNSNELKELLVRQIESSVRWRESVLLMIEKGVTEFIEIGPGKVLSGLIKRIDRNVKVSAINSEEDIKLININE